MSDLARHENSLMTVEDVATYTRLSVHTIRKWVQADTIPVVRIGRRTLFRRAEIDEWIEAGRVRPDGEAA